MLGVDAPNAQALDEIRQFMEVRERQHIAVTVGEIQRRYQAAPYGWREIDVAALIATLMRAQKLQLIRDNLAIPYAERRAVDCLRRRADMDNHHRSAARHPVRRADEKGRARRRSSCLTRWISSRTRKTSAGRSFRC